MIPIFERKMPLTIRSNQFAQRLEIQRRQYVIRLHIGSLLGLVSVSEKFGGCEADGLRLPR